MRMMLTFIFVPAYGAHVQNMLVLSGLLFVTLTVALTACTVSCTPYSQNDLGLQ